VRNLGAGKAEQVSPLNELTDNEKPLVLMKILTEEQARETPVTGRRNGMLLVAGAAANLALCVTLTA